MSDGITEARKGTYWSKKPTPTSTDNSHYLLSIMNPELYNKIMKKKKIKYSTDLQHMPNQKWHKYLVNIEEDKDLTYLVQNYIQNNDSVNLIQI